MFPVSPTHWKAAQDFQRARQKAALRDILARFTGKTAGLLSYEEVRRQLRAQSMVARGLHNIPLAAIIGSVGRYNDFTRDFLPRQDEDKDRWVRVKMATLDQAGVPPIEVYQIGETYFVLDGNHRVSVARQLGATHIEALVTEVKTKVPLTPDDRPDDLIIKAEYIEFLETTHLDELRPGADLSVTIPGRYRILEEHIQVHRYFMGLEKKDFIPNSEAVVHWYDTVYLPVVHVVRARGILKDFPDRTEADLYLWLSEHRSAIEAELGWEIAAEAAASDLSAQYGVRRAPLVLRLSEKLLEALLPDELEPGPPPGEWRRDRSEKKEGCLFADVLLPINGEEEGWHALEQAIIVARREGSRLRGLHILSSEGDKDNPAVIALQQEFERRCQQAGLSGKLALASGTVWQVICDRARWTDLTVLTLTYPPGPQPLSRLSSGFGNLIRHCVTPILAVPERITPLNSVLLAYDGSPKGEEALFVAAYLAGKWQIPLTVVTIFGEANILPETLMRARLYLEEHEIEADFDVGRGPVAAAILLAAEAHQSDLIVMGGYGANPVMEVALGSSVDQVLRHSRKPMLICR